MRPFDSILLSAFLLALPACNLAAAQPSTPSAPASIGLPAGTKVEMFVTRPVRALTAKTGDQFYAQTSFPVVTAAGIAIPAGTYVEGRIESVAKPSRRNSRAQLQVLFTQLVFANGYVVLLPGDPGAAAAVPNPDAETLIAITIQTTMANDLLLDNGADVEMTLAAPLTLDAQQVAQAAPLSRTPQPAQFKSATQCRFIPGSPGSPGMPGTPDTVIPGSPGTPDTVIPGGPGMPDTVIPGTPATPDTVIPGSPGTPGTPDTPATFCPAAPMVVSCTPVVHNAQSSTAKPVAAR